MRSTDRLVALFVASLTIAATSTRADTFTLSDTFSDHTVVSATFDGTSNGELITDLSNISITADGVAIIGPIFDLNTARDAGGVVAFDGIDNDFIFFNSEFLSNVVGSGDLQGGTFGVTVHNLQASSNLTSADSGYANWSVVDTSAPSVPEGGATVAMIGAAIIGLACFRYHKQLRAFFGRGN
jgi:hypothetical protein